ncbi:MAG: SDR family NAD(P)-dependent oxidoreductase [Acidobacteriota bacterium]
MTRMPLPEPLAIVGIGCRFPGGASDPASFWSLLHDGLDAVVDVPPERWDQRRFYSPDPASPGRLYVAQGGFLREPIDRFDAQFFGISPREAEVMDPQQRLLLEVAWEAFEDAGLVVERVGERTGVYIGAFCFDNALQQMGVLSRDAIVSHTATSASMVMLSNRLSHAFDLRGPSLTVDTACSSSLVAVHLAAQALWRGECDVALAGGVNVMLRPESTILECKGGFLSPDARCKAFDESANGYVRGEGAGVVVLRPLAAAREAGDRIHALLCATGVNQDGRTPGLTVPSGEAQERLVRETCRQAGVAPGSIRYVEAHGTGTQAGDPVEINALGRVLAEGRPPGDKAWVGSVKTNIGHLEAGAGVAGLIKAALCLSHREVPPHLHFRRSHPRIDFDALCLRVPLAPRELPPDGVLHAAVNSFGYGGTNAHAVLCTAAAEGPPAEPALLPAQEGSRLFVLSARSPEALADLAGRTGGHLAADGAGDLADLCHTAALRRSQHSHRLAVRADSRSGLAASLAAWAAGEGGPEAAAGYAPPKAARKLLFVYTGMGGQNWGMGADLAAREPVFRQALETCDGMFRQYGGDSLLEVFAPSGAAGTETGAPLTTPEIAQPANLALQVALTELWRSWGVEPDGVIGHSVGEIAAAWAAGSLGLEEAVRLTHHRSRLQQRLAGRGSLLAVGLPADEVRLLLAGLAPGGFEIGAENGPASVTLSGGCEALREVAAVLARRGVFHRFLRAEVAYHSRQMDALEEELRGALSGLRPARPHRTLYSTVTGRRVESDLQDADYWWRNTREPVAFRSALELAAAEGFDAFLEIGPHPVLAPAILDTFQRAGRAPLLAASLRRESDGRDSLLDAAARLHVQGFHLDWSRLAGEGSFVLLPTYPWQREALWNETRASRADRLVEELHPLLHRRLETPVPTWETEVHRRFFPDLAEHRIGGAAVFPAAAWLAAALAAGGTRGPGRALEEVELHRALLIDTESTVRLQVDEKDGRFTFHGRPAGEEGAWVLHASGRLFGPVEPRCPEIDLAAVRERCRASIDPEDLYRRLAARGMEYGPRFRLIRGLAAGDGEVLARLEGHPETALHGLHPTRLDAGFQALLALDSGDGGAFLPVGAGQVRLHASPGAAAWAYGRVTRETERSFEADVVLCDEQGRVQIEVLGLRCRRLAPAVAPEQALALYAYHWEAAPAPAEPGGQETWLLFADAGGLAGGLARSLAPLGRRSRVIQAPAGAAGRVGFRRALVEAGEPLGGVAWLQACDGADDVGLASSVAVLHLVQALAEVRPAGFRRLALVTRGGEEPVEDAGTIRLGRPGPAALWGLGRVIASEHPELGCVRIDVDPEDLDGAGLRALAAELAASGPEDEVALRGGERFVHRLVRLPEPSAAPRRVTAEVPFVLEIAAPGVLDSLAYRETARRRPGPGEVEIKVRATSLHFKDLMKAMNLLSASYLEKTFIGRQLGMECSGVVVEVGEGVQGFSEGDRVMVIDGQGCFRSFCTVPTGYLALQPDCLSFEESPCLINFVTPYYGLRYLARLEPGETVLIHSAAGGVGLAALQIARWLGAEVLATSGSEEKRDHLRSLGVEHVMDSRSLRFFDEVLERTGGRGVDVVLNSLSGEALRKSVELLAPYGRLIEIGKRDIVDNGALPLGGFDRNLMFAAVDTDRMGAERPRLFRRLIDEVLDLFRQGALRPLPVTVFDAAEAAAAFHHMARARHIGKVVIRMDAGEVPVRPREDGAELRADRTYLVTGGLGGFGLEVAQWLVSRGARHLVLAGRSGAASPAAQSAVSRLEDQGARVEVARVDVSREEEVAELLAGIRRTLPPLAGVLHAAMVLDDAALTRLDAARFAAVMRPKALGAWHLHRQTMDQTLDLFVLFSSISGLLGNPGQGSYAAANAFLDALARHRRSLGLPGLSVAWGPVGGIGVAARTPGLAERLDRLGLASLAPDRALRLLGDLLVCGPAEAGAAVIDWERWAEAHPGARRTGRYSRLIAGPAENGGPEAPSLAATVRQARPEERSRLVRDFLRDRLARVMRLPADRVELELSLDNMGVDSLMGMEMVGAIRSELGIEIPAMLLLQGQSVAAIGNQILERLEPAAPAAPPQPLDADRVDELSEAELDSLLLRMTATPAGELLREGRP